ncbi:MAG: helix-turn-helix transcriptional regulator [Oscillospiraceae bacterium]|nr:helix-turn-helix transcriptional regulator [Oscillospiraceae bacterium]
MIRIKLSTKLGELRWSQADLSRATKIRPNTICEIYNECCNSISITNLDRICEALNCDISDILEYVPNKEKITVSRTGH